MVDVPKKKYYGIGNLLPKVPSYLINKGSKEASPPNAAEPGGGVAAAVADEDPLTNEHRPPPADGGVRMTRGLSTDSIPGMAKASALSSLLYRKISFRGQPSSTTDNDNTSGGGGGSQRNSLTDSQLPSSPRVADTQYKVRRGACVATIYGTGTVLEIRDDDGCYIVQLVPKSIAYLRDDAIVREIKAVVGERVRSRWGLATVENYYLHEDMYSIALDWRWDDDHVWRMKATTKKFEKIHNRSYLPNLQNTKNYLYGGYSTFRESTSVGYANVVARMTKKYVYVFYCCAGFG